MATIRWSTHKDDAKVGTVEDVEDNAAARFVATGMARYADPDPEPETKVEVDTAATDAATDTDTAPTDGDSAPSDPSALDTQAGQPAAATDPDGDPSPQALDPLAAVVDAPDDSSSTPVADGDPAVETGAPKASRRGPSAKR